MQKPTPQIRFVQRVQFPSLVHKLRIQRPGLGFVYVILGGVSPELVEANRVLRLRDKLTTRAVFLVDMRPYRHYSTLEIPWRCYTFTWKVALSFTVRVVIPVDVVVDAVAPIEFCLENARAMISDVLYSVEQDLLDDLPSRYDHSRIVQLLQECEQKAQQALAQRMDTGRNLHLPVTMQHIRLHIDPGEIWRQLQTQLWMETNASERQIRISDMRGRLLVHFLEEICHFGEMELERARDRGWSLPQFVFPNLSIPANFSALLNFLATVDTRRVSVTGDEVPHPLSGQIRRSLVRVLLERDYVEFDDAASYVFMMTLADLLGIYPLDIYVRYVMPGSVLITMEIPEVGASKFMDMYLLHDPVLEQLHIRRVEVRPALPMDETAPYVVTPGIDYQLGLDRLRSILKDTKSDFMPEYWILRHRLLVALEDAHLFGLSDENHRERLRVVSALDDLMIRSQIGEDFLTLCQPDRASVD